MSSSRSFRQALKDFDTHLPSLAYDIRTEQVNGHLIQICLISRRSRYRAGTRYFRRGVDSEGHVANFNETEQILIIDPNATNRLGSSPGEYGARLSFVQIRGSIPLYWAEVNTLAYKPDLVVMEKPDSVRHLCLCANVQPDTICRHVGGSDAETSARAGQSVWRAEYGEYGQPQGSRKADKGCV